jgi:predicted secreted Zn-dependent protease
VKSILLFIFGILVISPNRVLAKISFTEKYDFYHVHPYSKADILISLNQATPISENGEKFHGYAYSSVKWNFRWKYNSKSCWITSVDTDVNTAYTLPKLGTNIVDVNEIWEQWYPKLVLHEKGHHKLAVKMAKKIESAISDMPAETNCSALEKKANAIGHGYISELDVLNKQYDQRTSHGKTQGASLFSYL